MSETNEPAPASRRNPLIWIVLVVVGLILFVFVSSDRGKMPGKISIADTPQQGEIASTTTSVPDTSTDEMTTAAIDESMGGETSGTIDRSLLVPPGMRARQYIEQVRELGRPYPLSKVFDKAQVFQDEGSLADAHLLYFFAARENHLPAMMVMAEMSDPLYFDASVSLLDSADAIQAYKWYRKAADLGQPQAALRLEQLTGWAGDAAAGGDSAARQLLLNIQ